MTTSTGRGGALWCPDCGPGFSLVFQVAPRVWDCPRCVGAWSLAELNASSSYRQNWIDTGHRAQHYARGARGRDEDRGMLRGRAAATLAKAAKFRRQVQHEDRRHSIRLARWAVGDARAYRLNGGGWPA